MPITLQGSVDVESSPRRLAAARTEPAANVVVKARADAIRMIIDHLSALLASADVLDFACYLD